jgi:RhtB (resistance to homoserine/threonine) family protein
MLQLLITIALLNLLAAMAPGPDFAIVTRNTLLCSRTSGIFTSLGIASGVIIHVTYCSLGLAIIITHSSTLFNIIKFAGGSYLIYIGYQSIRSKTQKLLVPTSGKTKQTISKWQAYRQGFLTNLLNPKATLFFLALFTLVVDSSAQWFNVIIALTLFATVFLWFSTLTLILSHPKIKDLLQRGQGVLLKATGVFLIGFGIVLFFAKVQQ